LVFRRVILVTLYRGTQQFHHDRDPRSYAAHDAGVSRKRVFTGKGKFTIKPLCDNIAGFHSVNRSDYESRRKRGNTMSIVKQSALIAAVVAALWTVTVHADEVVLRNGDRISGKVVELIDGKLSIETEYAGVVKLDWSQVETFSTDQPIYVKIGDNVVRATVSEADSGTATLSSEDWLETEPIELSRLSAMNYEPKPTVRVSGRINIGASSTSGNTNVDKTNGDIEVVARTDKNRFALGGEVNRAKNEGVETESNWLAYLKYDHFISNRWYAFANMSGENDEFKDIRLRTTIGLGTGYQWFDTEKTKLSLELGVNYVNVDRIVSTDTDYPAARWALDFLQKLFNSKTEFFHRHALFSSLDDSENFFIRTRTGLRLPIIENLNSTIQYNYDWDDNPAPGRLKEDKAWLFTLGYRW
jgi:putative salt-induced outer membrane protein YdiY